MFFSFSQMLRDIHFVCVCVCVCALVSKSTRKNKRGIPGGGEKEGEAVRRQQGPNTSTCSSISLSSSSCSLNSPWISEPIVLRRTMICFVWLVGWWICMCVCVCVDVRARVRIPDCVKQHTHIFSNPFETACNARVCTRCVVHAQSCTHISMERKHHT